MPTIALDRPETDVATGCHGFLDLAAAVGSTWSRSNAGSPWGSSSVPAVATNLGRSPPYASPLTLARFEQDAGSTNHLSQRGPLGLRASVHESDVLPLALEQGGVRPPAPLHRSLLVGVAVALGVVVNERDTLSLVLEAEGAPAAAEALPRFGWHCERVVHSERSGHAGVGLRLIERWSRAGRRHSRGGESRAVGCPADAVLDVEEPVSGKRRRVWHDNAADRRLVAGDRETGDVVDGQRRASEASQAVDPHRPGGVLPRWSAAGIEDRDELEGPAGPLALNLPTGLPSDEVPIERLRARARCAHSQQRGPDQTKRDSAASRGPQLAAPPVSEDRKTVSDTISPFAPFRKTSLTAT